MILKLAPIIGRDFHSAKKKLKIGLRREMLHTIEERAKAGIIELFKSPNVIVGKRKINKWEAAVFNENWGKRKYVILRLFKRFSA